MSSWWNCPQEPVSKVSNSEDLLLDTRRALHRWSLAWPCHASPHVVKNHKSWCLSLIFSSALYLCGFIRTCQAGISPRDCRQVHTNGNKTVWPGYSIEGCFSSLPSRPQLPPAVTHQLVFTEAPSSLSPPMTLCSSLLWRMFPWYLEILFFYFNFYC